MGWTLAVEEVGGRDKGWVGAGLAVEGDFMGKIKAKPLTSARLSPAKCKMGLLRWQNLRVYSL